MFTKDNCSLFQATNIRNYLMVIMCVINGARASNLINITTEDVTTAVEHEEFPAYVFKSKNYKTSIIYGTKIMVVPEDIYNFYKIFVNYVRPIISSPASKYLFTSSRDKADGSSCIEHSLISNGMTKSFQLANVLANKSTRVSPSRIRCAVVTDLVGVNGEKCSTVAEQFMKHRETTSRKFYICHWANRESMRLSMNCYSRFIKKDVAAVAEERNKLMSLPPPKKSKIVDWMRKNSEKIKKTFDNDMEKDEGLLNCLQEMSEDEGNYLIYYEKNLKLIVVLTHFKLCLFRR